MLDPTLTRRHLVSTLALATAFSGLACDAYNEPLQPPPGLVVQEVAPPAISGGTLLVTESGKAVVADADRDRVWIVDPRDGAMIADVALEAGDEPGRVTAGRADEYSDELAHVALRGGGALLTLDVASGKVLARREACAAPRGVAYDKALDAVHVACAGGELLTFPAAGGEATRKLKLDADLRDVVVDGATLVVTRFRSAEVLVLAADGEVVRRTKPPIFMPAASAGSQAFEPTVAWRMTAMPGGGVVISHQRSMTTPIVLAAPAYYSAAGCDSSIVHGTVTIMRDASEPGALASATIPFAPLPVDVAVAQDGSKVAMVAAGSDQVFISDTALAESEVGLGDCSVVTQPVGVTGQPVAAAFDADGRLLVQTREPAALLMIDENRRVQLSGDSVWDTGHDMFHRSPNQFAPTSVACASCHPEGRDDGHTWAFDIGMRRTQHIAGGVLETAPLHWDGDLPDMDAFMGEVFMRRMSGELPGARKTEAFARWVDALPMVPASEPEDIDAVTRGRALFEDATVACSSCHGGPRFTNGENKDVGTGKAFQVPSLIGIALRAPFMHDGCAKTLRDRFTPGACGGADEHGKTSHLDEAQIDDLVSYLESL
jgi:mono/diheme cytochrome c family protein/DNA-binding beta-propeller fold protein YncE